MAASGPRMSVDVRNKVLYVGVEKGGRESHWKISGTNQAKAEMLREIADTLDPPPAAARRRRSPRVVEEDLYEDDDDEWDRTAAHSAPRRAPRRAQDERRQVATPYPPLDPAGEFSGRQRPAPDFVDHSRGLLPDGTPIHTPIPADRAEAESMAQLSREAYEKAQAHAGALSGGDIADQLPIIEARPKAVRRSQGLDSQGRGFLPPAAHQELGEGQKVRVRPKITDPSFYYKDTH